MTQVKRMTHEAEEEDEELVEEAGFDEVDDAAGAVDEAPAAVDEAPEAVDD